MADIYIGNVKGPQGETGATGAQGPQGDAATIAVGTVSTTAYGNTAQVINTGTSSEAVFDFVIPQGRPGEEVTQMSALTLDTVTAQSAEFPIPATGESGSVVFGKIIKFFNDIKTAIVSKINYSDCVNGFTSTSDSLPLAAAAGKTLNDNLEARIQHVVGNSDQRCYFYKQAPATYGAFIIIGLLAGQGTIAFLITISGSAIDKKINLLTGQEFSTYPGVTFAYNSSNRILALYPTSASNSYFTGINA